MTYSIVAWDSQTGMTGVGVATKHLAVGSLVPHARPGVGAVATQASTNPYFGPWGLDRLEQLQQESQGERGAEAVLESLLQDDPGRDARQMHLVDAQGRTAAWTGAECAGLAAHRCYPGFSVAGNYLASELVLLAMAEAFMAAERRGLPLEQRLLLALEAAEAHGGDYRGRQSAALLVMHQESYPHIDFRVDHHPEPLVALREILSETQQAYYTGFRATLPTTLGVAQSAELQSTERQSTDLQSPALQPAEAQPEVSSRELSPLELSPLELSPLELSPLELSQPQTAQPASPQPADIPISA